MKTTSCKLLLLLSKNNLMSCSTTLDPEKIVETIAKLEKRIADRFPDSGLRKLVNQFLEIAGKSKSKIEWIAKPNLTIRILTYFVIIIGIAGLIYSLSFIDLKIQNKTLGNIISISEALFNDLILIGAAIFFLVTIETRVKKTRASKLLNELRVLAHVIDMHQLTKDPAMLYEINKSTEHSPVRKLSKFELQRYLDYCSEVLSLIGKVAALYAQSLPIDVVVRAVNEIEVLTNSFSRKIWQKLVILSELEEHSQTKKASKRKKEVNKKSTAKKENKK
jgi:hypothetical protein